MRAPYDWFALPGLLGIRTQADHDSRLRGAMPERSPDLPNFSDPPVVEVVLGVQFEAIRELRQSHFGLIWERIRADYPRTTDHARLETALLTIDTERTGPSFQLEMLDSPPTHRSWFLSEDDERLVQVQDDRVVHNWRHRGGPYPRFEPLRDQFWAAFDAYRSALDGVGMGPPEPRQVEVTYINWIADAKPADFLRTVTRAPTDVEGVGAEPDIERWLARYPVEQDGTIGRLTIEAKPSSRVADGTLEHGYLLSLTYLGLTSPEAADEGIDAQLQRGRDVIVRSFADVTEDAMHDNVRWGRIS